MDPNLQKAFDEPLALPTQSGGADQLVPAYTRTSIEARGDSPPVSAGLFEAAFAEPLNLAAPSKVGRSSGAGSPFVQSMVRGVDNLQTSGFGTLRLLGDLTGYQWMQQLGKEGVERNMLEAARNPARIESFDDVHSLGDLGTYVLETIGEQVPNLLSLASGGGSAALLTRAAIGKGLLGQIEKQAAHKAIKRGAIGGAAAVDFPIQTGETYNELKRAGVKDGEITSLVAGGVKTLLDIAGLERGLSIVFKGLDKEMSKDIVAALATKYVDKGVMKKFLGYAAEVGKQGLKGATAGAAIESSTEALQQLVDVAARAYEDPGFDPFGPEAMAQVKEAAIRGGIAGSTFTGGGRAVTSSLSIAGAPREVPSNKKPPEDQNGEVSSISTPTGEVSSISTPTTESQATIDAQARAVLDPTSSKDSVLVTPGSPNPSADVQAQLDRAGAQTVQTPQGALTTTDPEKAAAPPTTDAGVGQVLYGDAAAQGKPADADRVVQALDQNGQPVTEIAAGPSNLDQARQVAPQQAPAGGTVVEKPIAQVLSEREQRRVEDEALALATKLLEQQARERAAGGFEPMTRLDVYTRLKEAFPGLKAKDMRRIVSRAGKALHEARKVRMERVRKNALAPAKPVPESESAQNRAAIETEIDNIRAEQDRAARNAKPKPGSKPSVLHAEAVRETADNRRAEVETNRAEPEESEDGADGIKLTVSPDTELVRSVSMVPNVTLDRLANESDASYHRRVSAVRDRHQAEGRRLAPVVKSLLMSTAGDTQSPVAVDVKENKADVSVDVTLAPPEIRAQESNDPRFVDSLVKAFVDGLADRRDRVEFDIDGKRYRLNARALIEMGRSMLSEPSPYEAMFAATSWLIERGAVLNTDPSSKSDRAFLESLVDAATQHETASFRDSEKVDERADPITGVVERLAQNDPRFVDSLVKAFVDGLADRRDRVEFDIDGKRYRLNARALIEMGRSMLSEPSPYEAMFAATSWLIERGAVLNTDPSSKSDRAFLESLVDAATQHETASFRDSEKVDERADPITGVVERLAQKGDELRKALASGEGGHPAALSRDLRGIMGRLQFLIEEQEKRNEAELEHGPYATREDANDWFYGVAETDPLSSKKAAENRRALLDEQARESSSGAQYATQMPETREAKRAALQRALAGVKPPRMSVTTVPGATYIMLKHDAKAIAGLLQAAGVGLTDVRVSDVSGLQEMVARAKEFEEKARTAAEQAAAGAAKKRGSEDNKAVSKTHAEKIKDSHIAAQRNLALLEETLAGNYSARALFLETVDGKLTPVVFINDALSGEARAHAVLHEAGHIVLRHAMETATAETIQAMQKAFAVDTFHDFEEAFAEAYVKWATGKLFHGTDSVAAETRSVIGKFFRALRTSIRRLAAAASRWLGLRTTEQDIIEGLLNAHRVRTGQPAVSMKTAYGMKVAPLLEGLGRTQSLTAARINKFTSQRALNAPSVAAVVNHPLANKVKNAAKGFADIARAAHGAFTQGFGPWLRSNNLAWLDDMTRHVPGSRVARNEATYFHELRGQRARFMAPVHDIARHFPVVGLFNIIRGRNPKLSPEAEAATQDLVNERASTSPIVAEVRAVLDAVHSWLNENFVDVEYRKNYFPFMMNQNKLSATGAHARFIQLVKDWGNTPEGKTWWQQTFGKIHPITPQALERYAEALYRAFSETDGTTARMKSGSLELIAPGFNFRNAREIAPELTNKLTEFRETDVMMVLNRYVTSAVKRGTWQRQFGLNQELGRIRDKYATDTKANADKYYNERKEHYRQTYGVDIHDPSADVLARLVEEERRNNITPEARERVINTILPAYQGRLGSTWPANVRRLSAAVLVYQNMRVLSMGVFAQFVDIGLILHKVKGHRVAFFMEGIRALLNKTKRKELIEAVRLAGIASDDMTDHILMDDAGLLRSSFTANRLNEKFFRLNGMHYMTEFLRALNYSIAKRMVEQWVAENNAAEIERHGMSLSAAASWVADGMPSAWSEKHAAAHAGLNQIVDESVLRPEAPTKPYLGNDQRLALLWHLKGFTWSYAYTVLTRVNAEAKRKWGETQGLMRVQAALPFIMLAIWTMAFSALGMELREALFGRAGKRPSGWDYYWEVAQRAGLAGIVQPLIDAEQAKNFGTASYVAVAGPTVSQLDDFLRKDFGTALSRSYPAYPAVRGIKEWFSK